TGGIVEMVATHKSVILVVEDEKESRDSLQGLFEFEGYGGKTAMKGQGALGPLNTSGDQICIVLLDLFMPVMSGWQVIEQLRAQGRLDETQIVVITSAPHIAPAGLPAFQHPPHP